MTNNTGVEESRVADAVDVENESTDFTLYVPEDDAPDIEFADLFEDEKPETVEEATGDDNPPEAKAEESVSTQQEPQPQTQPTTPETPNAFAKRLSAEKRKMEASLGATLEEAQAIILEDKARKLMESNKEMNMTLDFAKRIVKGEQPAPTPESTSDQRFEIGTEEHKAWWKQRLVADEPMLQVALNDPNITVSAYASKNAAFKAALSAGNTPMQALTVARAVEAQMNNQVKTAATDAKKQMLQQIGDSNARAVTPVNSQKPAGQQKSMDEWLKTATIDDMRTKVREAERRGGRGINFGSRNE